MKIQTIVFIIIAATSGRAEGKALAPQNNIAQSTGDWNKSPRTSPHHAKTRSYPLYIPLSPRLSPFVSLYPRTNYYSPYQYPPIARRNPYHPVFYQPVGGSNFNMNGYDARRNDAGSDLLKQYFTTMLLMRLFNLEPKPIAKPATNQQRRVPVEHSPTVQTVRRQVVAFSTTTTKSLRKAKPTTTVSTTTVDPFADWLTFGDCRYRSFVRQQNYYAAKIGCSNLGARLASPSVMGSTADIASLSTEIDILGVSYWVGAEEDSNRNDISSDQEPRYSANAPFEGQECLAIVSQSNAVLKSYTSCDTMASASLCQVC